MKDSVVFIRPKFEEKSDMQREQSCSPTPPPPPTWKVFRHLKVPGKSQSFASMAAAALPSTRAVIVLSVVFSLLAAAVSVPWINNSLIITSTTGVPIAATSSKTLIIAFNTSISDRNQPAESASPPPTLAPPPLAIIPFSCPALNQTKTTICKAIPSIPPPENSLLSQTLPTCPDYFRWIHEDLSPWRRTGITKEMVELAGRTANFRLVILGGRAFVQRLRPSFQTRDVFTIWGIVQLLRRYPGKVPDLDLMFDTVDYPVVKAAEYRGRNASAPPPLFRYCGDDSTLDVVFPDWSFWGWPEINIKPWERLRQELREANEKVKWMDREPYAYWKGNPAVAAARRDLLRCNVSESHDWNARLYAQDWQSEINKGFKESNLSSQCLHRYKIYIEGSAWSVSEKYILACNSMTLIVKPRYYDFFTRGLMPVHHYWPVRHDDKCGSIKFAVDWANSHKRKAQAIGNAASSFIEEKLKMDDVYDYMFHLLNEYSKLLRFRPVKPRRAIELCAEAMACPAQNLTKRFMMDSMVRSPHGSPPCALSPPLSPAELRAIQWRKANSIKQVEIWEERARESHKNK